MREETLILAKKIICSALSCSVSELPENASFDNFVLWDSMGHMRIIVALEEHINRSLDSSEILDIVNINAICIILSGEKSV